MATNMQEDSFKFNSFPNYLYNAMFIFLNNLHTKMPATVRVLKNQLNILIEQQAKLNLN